MSKGMKIRSISFEGCLDKLIAEKKEEMGLSITAYVKACVMADLFPELRVDSSAKLSVDEVKMLNTYATQDFSEEYKEFIYFRMAKAKGLHKPVEEHSVALEQEPILEQSASEANHADLTDEELQETYDMMEQSQAESESLDVPKWINSKDNNANTDANAKTNDNNNDNTNNNTVVVTKAKIKTKTSENTKKKPAKPFKMDDMSFEGTSI